MWSACSFECISSNTGVSSHLMGKPSAPNLSPSQAVSLTLLDMYRPVLMRADIVTHANDVRLSNVVIGPFTLIDSLSIPFAASAYGRAGSWVKVKIGSFGVMGGGRDHFAVALYHPSNQRGGYALRGKCYTPRLSWNHARDLISVL